MTLSNKKSLAPFVCVIPAVLYAVSWYMYAKGDASTANTKSTADKLYYSAIATQVAAITFLIYLMMKQ